MSEKKVLEMKGITKIYPGVRALDGVDFIVEEGSVHALMGENGAGKSTLIKILTGVIGKDSGSIVLSGKEVNFHSVYEANNNGISAVYQELDLIPELSIGENIFMGREMMKKGSIDWKNTYKEADKILKSMGILLDVTAKLSSLGTAMQQMVSIPLMKPTLSVCVTLCVSGCMKLFDTIYAMTGGGPGRSSTVTALYAYDVAFKTKQFLWEFIR